MAEDTRKQTSEQVKSYKAVPRDPDQPEHKKPRVFIHKPSEDPEAEQQAKKDTSVLEAAKTIQWEDFSKVGQTPCFRNAMLPGIGGGLGLGAARFVLGGSVMAACNWASGAFLGVSVVAYNWCQRKRQLEKDNIKRAVKVLDEKQALKDSQTGKPLEAGGQRGAKPLSPNSKTQPNPTVGGDPSKQGVPFWQSFKFW